MLEGLIGRLEEKREDLDLDPQVRAHARIREMELHQRISSVSKELFEDGYYANSVFEASKALINFVKERSMRDDLDWLGLEWDAVEAQSDQNAAHAQALDRLGEAGLLYPCQCSRKDIAKLAVRAPDGGWRYENTCRDRELPVAGWRDCRDVLRVRLPDEVTGT